MQLVFGTIVVTVNVLFHVGSLVYLAALLQRVASRSDARPTRRRTTVLVAVATLFIVAIHTVEAWLWAGLYLSIGEFSTLREALYFSVTTATTLGHGDVLLSDTWKLLGTFEAMGGFILFGVSTAFLFEMLRRFLGAHEESS